MADTTQQEVRRIRMVLEAINTNLTDIAKSLQKIADGDSQEKQGS